MYRRSCVFISCLMFLAVSVFAQAEEASLPASSGIGQLESFQKEDRVLILTPHPDDEMIACAGVIQAAVAAGSALQVAYLTNGDHNQLAFIVYEKRLTIKQAEFIHMGKVRRKEAVAAMKSLGVDESNLVFLGYPDFGTFTIFRDYWQTKKPFKSILTRISAVPYKENLSFDAPYVGESILNDLKSVILKFKPNKIFVSHPADVNVDHKSLYLFMQVALSDLANDLPRPKIYPYLVHCVGWPLPRHYHPKEELLPPKQFGGSQLNWVKLDLSAEALEKKRQGILCYKSQTSSSAFYLLAFARKNELFGDYPEVDLKLPAKEEGISQKPSLSLFDKAKAFFGGSNLFTDSGVGAEIAPPQSVFKVKGQVNYRCIDGALLIHIEKTEELSSRFSSVLYLFGYSDKVPFSQMPKIRIITKHKEFKIFDGRKMIDGQGVVLELKPRELLIKVPLDLLGDPQFVLTSAKTFSGLAEVDTMGFRKIDIRKGDQNAGI